MIPPFVDPAWLAEHPETVLVDARSYVDGRSGAAAYARGHLPGAVHLGLEEWLSGPASPATGRHPLPGPEVFAEGMARSGIGDDDLVVAYDDDAGVIAARLVWMLRAIGHDAAVLQGWRGPLEAGAVTRPRAVFTPRPWPADRLASIDDAAAAEVLLDARPAARFAGEGDTLDPRAGHIPGARSVPCRDNVGADGRLLPDDELRARLADLPAGWVSSCGSGVTACHTLLVAEHLGLPPGRLFPGSWSQWAASDRPIER